MRKIINIGFMVVLLLSMIGCSGCSRKSEGDKVVKQDTSRSEDVLVGTLSVAVDESIYPLVEEQVEVFSSAYPNAQVKLIVKPELLAVRDLLANTATVAILSRELDETERDYFAKRSIIPRVFPVWTDAMVLLNNTSQADTSVTIEYMLKTNFFLSALSPFMAFNIYSMVTLVSA